MPLCYRDRAYCRTTCGNMACDRNPATIDSDHLLKVGLPVDYQNFKSKTCGWRSPHGQLPKDHEQ